MKFPLIAIAAVLLMLTSCKTLPNENNKPLPQGNDIDKIEQLEKNDYYIPWWLK